MNSSQQPIASRVLQLDVLRGVAILMVLGRHHPLQPSSSGILQPLVAPWKNFGWSGVDFFFVLSGFLIGGLLFRELKQQGALDIKRFIIRRGLKIWPGYLLLVLAAFMLTLLRSHSVATALHVMWPNFLHVQNYVDNPNRPALQTWSLAIEEHFYLALPIVLLLFWNYAKPKFLLLVPLASLLVGVVCLGLRLRINDLPFDSGTHVFPTHLRIDSMFCGVLLAYLYHFHPERWKGWCRYPLLLVAVGFALLLPVASVTLEKNPWVYSWGFCLLYLGYALILMGALSWPVRATPRALPRLLAWVGLSSYPIYLWHTLFAAKPSEWVAHRLHLPETVQWSAVTVVYLALAIFSGALLGMLVDKPVLRLRNRMFPARSTSI
jgi:peptidoglycan/LPS O-acetylase OafA/YrhL